MADVEVTIRLGGETCKHLAAGERQMLLAELWSYLGVLAGLVECTKESLLENAFPRRIVVRRCRLGLRRRRRLLRFLANTNYLVREKG
jgi:hypothetical protein